jgi:hypothetical protein
VYSALACRRLDERLAFALRFNKHPALAHWLADGSAWASGERKAANRE